LLILIERENIAELTKQRERTNTLIGVFEPIGWEGAKYVWDVIWVMFASYVSRATFSAPEGMMPDPAKTWKTYEEPIFMARGVQIKENRFAA